MRTIGVAFAVLAGFAAFGQQYVISTFAGGVTPPPVAARALDKSFHWPRAVAADVAGNVYFISDNSVFKLDKTGAVIRVAGGPRAGYSGDGGPATSAQLSWPSGLGAGGSGALFIADTGNNRIRKVLPNGVIVTIAGNGTFGFSGDGGPAVNAELKLPTGVAVDEAGNVFVADSFNVRIRKIAASGIITTVAGSTQGSSGDGGPATSAQFLYPVAVAVDTGGNLFIADQNDNRVRRISANGIITTVAGKCCGGGIAGDAGPATEAQLAAPNGLAVDQAGRLFILQLNFARVRRVSPNGIISTVVCCNSEYGFSGDGGPATSAGLSNPFGIAVDSAGALLIADTAAGRVRKVASDGIINTIAGNGGSSNYDEAPPSDGGPATSAQLRYPWSIVASRAGDVFIADTGNNRIRRVSRGGIITTVAGSGAQGFSGDGGPAVIAQLNGPIGLAVDGAGNLFFIDAGNSRVRKVSTNGVITTVAGNGKAGANFTVSPPLGDDGPAISATLSGFGACNSYCGGLAVDEARNLFIADSGYNRIRKVSPDGIITTVAGNGAAGYPGDGLPDGDGGPATDARIWYPTSVALDGAGNLYIAEPGIGRVRKVSPDGIITTIAGAGAYSGPSGDGGPAISARLSAPASLALDSAGNLFIADPGWQFFTGDAQYLACCDHRIREISPDGIITTVAGSGWGYSGDGGPASTGALNGPVSVATDADRNIYIADSYNDAIRVLRPTNYPALIGSVVDAASQKPDPVSPGKIVVIQGAGLGPLQLAQHKPPLPTEISGTKVLFNGIPAPILYTSATQVAVVVPAAISGTAAQVTVVYQGQASNAINVTVAQAAPSLFTASQAGWGQLAATNPDGTVNTPASPVKIGGVISLYATGIGQDASQVNMMIGGFPATVRYVGQAPRLAPGVIQVNVQIPNGVQPGGYVPVVLNVGDVSSTLGVVWIAVVGN